MKALICYATTDGQTRKIARYCADVIAGLDHSVELLTAADAEDLILSRFDGVILAGSVHTGGFQKDLVALATAHAAELAKLPHLFLCVSLTVAGDDPEDWDGLRDVVRQFAIETGWTPGQVLHVAGAFKFSEYDFFRSLAMRWIAAQKEEDVDPHMDKEYTDWAALKEAMRDWIKGIG